jgi:hypothetical protein
MMRRRFGSNHTKANSLALCVVRFGFAEDIVGVVCAVGATRDNMLKRGRRKSHRRSAVEATLSADVH